MTADQRDHLVPAGPDASEAASEAPDGELGANPAAEPLPELTEQALEALLFVAELPLSRRELASLSGADAETVDARLGDLEVALADRGIRLIRNGERVELATAPDAGLLIARYVGADASPRLSPAALETLAIVAYGQPMTKAGIERIRGVDSDYTIRALLHRRLVVELRRSEGPGRPFLYGTSFDFLERFGLTSLEELPPLDVEIAARLAEATDVAAAGQGILGLGDETGGQRRPARAMLDRSTGGLPVDPDGDA